MIENANKGTGASTFTTSQVCRIQAEDTGSPAECVRQAMLLVGYILQGSYSTAYSNSVTSRAYRAFGGSISPWSHTGSHNYELYYSEIISKSYIVRMECYC